MVSIAAMVARPESTFLELATVVVKRLTLL